MLPDVVAEDGVEALGEGRVLVGGGEDLELARGEDQPAPAGAELLGCGLVEGLFEGFEAAEVGGDLRGDGPVGAPPTPSEPTGPMRFQKAVWLEWPPPLLRTAVRIYSGTWAGSRTRSSTDLAASSGWLARAAFRLLT